jgi:hypothetical protein
VNSSIAAYLPLPKRFKDYSVSFRSVKLQKFGYRRIQFCCQFGSPALLTHGQPSALKRSKSDFLLVGHGVFVTRQATSGAKKKCLSGWDFGWWGANARCSSYCSVGEKGNPVDIALLCSQPEKLVDYKSETA